MAKKKKNLIRSVVTPGGSKFPITGEDGKYWLCGDTQFRKSLHYEIVEEEPAPQEETVAADGE